MGHQIKGAAALYRDIKGSDLEKEYAKIVQRYLNEGRPKYEILLEQEAAAAAEHEHEQ